MMLIDIEAFVAVGKVVGRALSDSEGLISQSEAARIIGVIGQCSVSACSAQAARHIEIHTRRSITISGVVCEHCAQATTFAAFLLDLLA